MALRETACPFSGIPSGHNPSPLAPMLGELSRSDGEGKNALSASGTSPIGRGKALIRHGCAVPPSLYTRGFGQPMAAPY